MLLPHEVFFYTERTPDRQFCSSVFTHSLAFSLTLRSHMCNMALLPSLSCLCHPLRLSLSLSSPSARTSGLCPSCVSRASVLLQAVNSECFPFKSPIFLAPALIWIFQLSLCQHLFSMSVNISFSPAPFPSQRPPTFLLPLPRFTSVFLSCSFSDLVAPFITFRAQPRASLSVSLLPPLPLLRLSAVDGNQVQSKPCLLWKNSNELTPWRHNIEQLCISRHILVSWDKMTSLGLFINSGAGECPVCRRSSWSSD